MFETKTQVQKASSIPEKKIEPLPAAWQPTTVSSRPSEGLSTTGGAGQLKTSGKGIGEASRARMIKTRQPKAGNARLLHMAGENVQTNPAAGSPSLSKGDRVTTPSFPPELSPPGTIPPSPQEERLDTEGNRIVRSASGHWYLKEEPQNLQLPLAPGHKYELLPINPKASYEALLNQCETIRDEQLAYSERLKGDMKYWFAKVYHHVTKFELEAIEKVAYQYPHAKMQMVILFNATFKANLDRWMAGQKDRVEENWRSAFAEAESMNDGSWLRLRSQEISKALIPSMEAHIRFDLPRAIATVHVLHYAGIPETSIGDFYSDFSRMVPVFEKASNALEPEMEDESFFFDPGDWNWLRDALFPFFFHIGLEREQTWEKVEAINRYRSRGLKAVARGVWAELTAAHPLQEPFKVGGKEIEGYDWLNQPGARPDIPGPTPVYRIAPGPPEFPRRLHFKLGLPRGSEMLEDAARSDQGLAPLLKLAKWTRLVRDAEIALEGHASSEGTEVLNYNLALARAELVRFFLFRASADLDRNRVTTNSKGDEGAEPRPEWRYVHISVLGKPVAKQQITPPNPNLPSEVARGLAVR